MNALKARQRYDAEQRALAYKKYREEEEAKLAAMSPEEREAYEAEQKKKTQNALHTLTALRTFAGPYSNI